MPDATVSETAERPLVSLTATGNYSGAEFISQTGQSLTLDLTKQADLTILPGSQTPPLNIISSEALDETVTKSGNETDVHFSLNVVTSATATSSDGTVNPFSASLSIQGDVTLKNGCVTHCQISYCGKSSQGDSNHSQSQGVIVIDHADTSYTFTDPGGTGFAALIMDNGAVSSAFSDTELTDAHMAAAGASGEILGATALEFAFADHSVDPVQGIDQDDAAVMRAMGEAALQMIAHPDSQAVATAAVVAATAIGARLAVDDGLRAFTVAAEAPHDPTLVTTHDGGFLFG